MNQPIAYKNEHGIWIYHRLPQNMRVATLNDFINKEGNLILGKKFLAKSFHFPRYEAHEVKQNFIEKWEHWLINKTLFILQ